MENKESNPSISFLGALTILFIGLKLGGVIDWSWWWVLAPVWVPTAIILAILSVVTLIAFFFGEIEINKNHEEHE